MKTPKFFLSVFLMCASLTLAGCIGSAVLNDSDEKNLRELPTLNSVPDRPTLSSNPLSAHEVQEMKKAQEEAFKKNEELRKKYTLEKRLSSGCSKEK